MISVTQACDIACDFYKKNFQIDGLAEVSETDRFYIFDGGAPDSVMYGGATICVNKEDGRLSILEFPSRESTELINSARVVQVPSEYYGK